MRVGRTSSATPRTSAPFRFTHKRQQDDNRLETIQRRYLQLPASWLGIHHRRRHHMDVPLVFWRITSSAATQVTILNEIGQFFYLSLQSDVNTSFFCDDLWAQRGESGSYFRAKEAGAAATSSGSPSIRPTARDMDSNTSQTTALTAAAAAWNSSVPPMVGSPGRLRSLFLTRLWHETLDVDTNGNLFIGGEGSTFYCVRSSNAQIGGQYAHFSRSTAVNLGGDLGSGGINPAGLDGSQPFW